MTTIITNEFHLAQKINDLTKQLDLQSELIVIKNDEIDQKDHMIETLSQEIETLKQNLNSLRKVMEEINAQNDRLIFSNQVFTKMLELQLEKGGKVIELNRVTQQNANLKEELAK